jgi:hypothetical protein
MLGAGPGGMLKMGKLFPLRSRCSDSGRGEVVATHFGAASVRVEGLFFAWLRAYIFVWLLLDLVSGRIDSVNIA